MVKQLNSGCYIDLVNLYLMFSKTNDEQNNDLDLFVYCLAKMCRRPNYSRWMVKYIPSLINAENTHPGIHQMLENGGLAAKKTTKIFARAPVDLTLQQTVNADAGPRLTGI